MKTQVQNYRPPVEAAEHVGCVLLQCGEGGQVECDPLDDDRSKQLRLELRNLLLQKRPVEQQLHDVLRSTGPMWILAEQIAPDGFHPEDLGRALLQFIRKGSPEGSEFLSIRFVHPIEVVSELRRRWLRRLTKQRQAGDDPEVDPIAQETVKESQLDEMTMPQAFCVLEDIEAELTEVRDRLRPELQDYLDAVVLASRANPDMFPSAEDKQRFARSLQVIFDRLGFRLCCPRCSEPATLIARGDRGSGRFTLAHSDGTHHFGGKSLPDLPLMDQPPSKRISG